MKRFLEFLGNVGLLLALALALFCLLARLFWGFELFTHYRPYWALNTLLVVALFAVVKCPRRAGGAALVAAYFAWPTLPYYLPKADPPGGERTLRVMHFNVLVSNRSYDEVIAYIREQDPDVVVLQEFEPKWRTAMIPLADGYPFREMEVRRGADAIGIFSKFPLSDQKWTPSKSADWPIFSAKVDAGGKVLHLVSLHPPPPMRQRTARLRNERLALAGELASGTGARLALGDFNCSPWSPHFRDFLSAAGLSDSSLGRGVTPTWHLFSGLAIPIDHILHSEEVEVLSREVGPDLGSDHRAVVVDVSY